MFSTLYQLSIAGKLGASGWYPIPNWLRLYLKQLPIYRQVVVYARLLKDADLSFIAPDEVACAESVTRLLNTIDPSLIPVITGTWSLLEYLVTSKRFREIPQPVDGCVILAATGTGNGTIANGHVGICDKGMIWNNNSAIGKWQKTYSYMTFRARYEYTGGMKVRYFLPINK